MKTHDGILALPLTQAQQFFATCWYNMVHMYSLDSYRVRAMNPKNIVRELLRMASPPAKSDDMAMVASEAQQLLGTDPQLKASLYQASLTSLKELLDPTKLKNSRDLEASKPMIKAYALELSHLLEQHYIDGLLGRLRELLVEDIAVPPSETEYFNEIEVSTGHLLSALLDGGASIESLYQLYVQVIVKMHQSAYRFERRFSLLTKLVTQQPKDFSIVFAIDSVTNPDEFPEQIGEVSFSVEAPKLGIVKPQVEKYAASSPKRIFARVHVNCPDWRVAGSKAYTEINNVMDLVRFEYERSHADVSNQFIYTEGTDSDAYRLGPIPKVVPNPTSSLNAGELKDFVQSVNELRSNPHFAPDGRDRIQSAFRLYRTGSDTNIFENKLTNWWTAVEYLVKGSDGSGGIGKGVEDALVPVLCSSYVCKVLRSLRDAIVDLKVSVIDPTTQLAIELHALSAPDLFALLRRADMREPLLSSIPNPFVRYKLAQFLDRVGDGKSLAAAISDHEQRLRWHLQRIWRARCDIVHSAERSVNTGLLCANLEFYLKSTLTSLLKAVGTVPTLSGPKEFFDRQGFQYQRLKSSLDVNDFGPLISTLN